MTFDNDMSGSSQGADVSENDRVRAVPDYRASSSFIVNFVFIAVLIVAMGGWLWLLGEGAAAVISRLIDL